MNETVILLCTHLYLYLGSRCINIDGERASAK